MGTEYSDESYAASGMLDSYMKRGNCICCGVEWLCVELGSTPSQAVDAASLFRDDLDDSCDEHSPIAVMLDGMVDCLTAMCEDTGLPVDDWQSWADVDVVDAVVDRGFLHWLEVVGVVQRVEV